MTEGKSSAFISIWRTQQNKIFVAFEAGICYNNVKIQAYDAYPT